MSGKNKDWQCPQCCHINRATNEVCMGSEMGDGRCGYLKPNSEKSPQDEVQKSIEGILFCKLSKEELHRLVLSYDDGSLNWDTLITVDAQNYPDEYTMPDDKDEKPGG